MPATAPQIDVSAAQRRVLIVLCRPFAGAGFATLPSNSEIAEELFLSAETVKSHLHALFHAFGLDDVPPSRSAPSSPPPRSSAGSSRCRI